MTNSSWYKLDFEYAISGTDSPELNVPIPINEISNGNRFAPLPYTGLPCKSTEEAGGQACVELFVSRYNTVKKGDAWNDALKKFINKYGAAGKFSYLGFMRKENMKYARWDLLCIGFAVHSEEVGRPVLVPGSICGKISNPDLTCNVTLPGTIDLGIVNAGTSSVSRAEYGKMECDQKATLSAALLNSSVINGNKVDTYLNGVALTGNAIDIVNNMENSALELRAEINGALTEPGEYDSPIIIQVSYR